MQGKVDFRRLFNQVDSVSGTSKGVHRHKGYMDIRYQVFHNAWWATHTWWGAHIHGGLASQPASFGGPGAAPQGRPHTAGRLAGCMWAPHHVCGFPTMHLGSPPCILIKGISYQVSLTRCQMERGWDLGTSIGTSIGPFPQIKVPSYSTPGDPQFVDHIH